MSETPSTATPARAATSYSPEMIAKASAPTATREPSSSIAGANPVRETLLPAYFGRFGGQEVPEFLLPALDELEAAYVEAMSDPRIPARVR